MIIGGLIISRVSSLSEKRRLAGNVTIDGTAAKFRIVIMKRGSLEYVASTVSDAATGLWEIRNVPEYPEKNLVVMAFDDTGEFNAEIADYISQVE